MYQEQVSFGDAVKRALTVNYCNFDGRSSRSEYWWYMLGMFILSAVLGFIFGLFFDPESSAMAVVQTAFLLVFLLPSLGLCVRRLHDIGKSGWWIFIGLIPIAGPIILIVWYAKESEMTPNQYGPVPNMTA